MPRLRRDLFSCYVKRSDPKGLIALRRRRDNNVVCGDVIDVFKAAFKIKIIIAIIDLSDVRFQRVADHYVAI